MRGIPSQALDLPYTPAERRADALVHWTGLTAAALGVPALLAIALIRHGVSGITLAALVYSATLLAMLGFSAAYHMSDHPRRRDILRRGDHAAIFAKIAGAYTPLTILHGGPMTFKILALLWGGALLGMAFKIGWPRLAERAAVVLYLALGWSVVVLGTPVLAALSPAGFCLTVSGGVLYTLGVIIFLWDGLPYQNAFWHGTVLAATKLVFAAIVVELAVAVPI